MIRFQTCVAITVLSLLCAPVFGQNGEVQDEHDRQIKADTKRNTEYHNNADDYPRSNSSAPNIPTPTVRIPITPKNPVYVPTMTPELQARWDSYEKVVAAERAGDSDAGLLLGTYQYKGQMGWPSPAIALQTWLKVADRNVSARFLAGRMIYVGDSTPSDENRGWAMMTSAANAGNAEAKQYLAAHPRLARTEHFPSMLTRISNGEADGVMQEKSDMKLEKRARNLAAGKLKNPTVEDYVDAAFMYKWGTGVPSDFTKAHDFAVQAGKMGPSEYSEADLKAILLKYAVAHREQDPDGFRRAVAASAAIADTTQTTKDAQYMQAAVACMDHDLKKERFLLGEAVKPIPEDRAMAPEVAHVDMALMQLSGEGGPVDEAGGMANLLAAKNNPEAAYYLSQFIASGTHLQPKNPELARQFLEVAAKGGQPDAVKQLAATATAGVK